VQGHARYNQKQDRALEREAEVELARRLIAGEPEAFDRFVEHFRAKIFHCSWLMRSRREDAEEVAQETLLSDDDKFSMLKMIPDLRAEKTLSV
jgi:hypothetical protein